MLGNDVPFAAGGPYRVEQPTAQQAPVVTDCQYKDFRTDNDTRTRHRAGVDDFDSGAAIFVGTDDSAFALTEYARRLQNLGQYMQPESESQPAVFSSLEVPYRFFYARRNVDPRRAEVIVAITAEVGAGGNRARDARLAAGVGPAATAAETAAAGAIRWTHYMAVHDVYENVRFIGFADTDMYMQNDHTRNGSGSRSVIVRASGDKTTCNTSWMFIGPAIHVAWFLPGDPSLTALNNNTMYPWGNMPAKDTVPWRAILMPLTHEVFDADPSAITRVVGKCLKPSQPNRALTLLVSSQPVIPRYMYGAAANIFEAGHRFERVRALETGAPGVPPPAPAVAPALPAGRVFPVILRHVDAVEEDEKAPIRYDEGKYAEPPAQQPAQYDEFLAADDQQMAYDDEDSMLMPPPGAQKKKKRRS